MFFPGFRTPLDLAVSHNTASGGHALKHLSKKRKEQQMSNENTVAVEGFWGLYPVT